MAVLKYYDSTTGQWKPSNSLPDTLTGSADPTTATEALYVGQFYLNTTSGQVFVCKAIQSSTYAWVGVASEEISEHNTDTTAHSDIRSEIDTDISTHNSSSSAHSDIRSSLNTVVSNTCNGLLKLVNTGVGDDGTYTFSLEQGGYIVLSSHPYGGRGLYLVSAYPAQSSITPVVSASTITSFTASGLSFTVSTSGNTRLWALRLGDL